MRPKKTVLYCSPNQELISLRAFALSTRGFRVSRSSNPHQAMRLLFAATCPDVFLIEMGKGASGNFLASAAKECFPDLRVLLVEDLPDHETACFADIVLPQGVEAAVLIERLRILTARKRGPKKRELPLPAWMPMMEGLA